ncbi:Putative branched-chain-amino-acid aminotransferase 7 [Morus notabilis]|uniref:Branched-chain-amino-acid aminotransferase n=2 Tax=Morus notabilis TaxID=981085 RepID=W9SFJ7_9ROSA|nr:putative branched-chain-amino-acid aminotransferase 7 isoform X2 [Morus notabilis]XP_024027199.1 putative branched-chain-amino-acid aminotransferase 7 isoform X2 [Morus notabilis]XP_024027200.1 putative branched-chain-amino-acid aminotransferase 7 isoform X2 [Morus notabilis]XP_024027202.1 putative branched-chain-amino-acid aminotransferase 7 isoform X2 [Morus notabilis]EXC04272.1 Putative branched-chain-amino-acid aminotransferase 7 [Morus notabilis]
MAPPPVQTSGETTPHRDGEQYANVNWDELGFDAVPTDYMYVMKCSIEEGDFSHGKLIPYGNIELSPSAGVLNYGQGLFEGLKAYRREDGRIQLFRPEQNALRMKMGAERMCMLSPTVEQFVDAVKQTVIANNRFVPPPGKGALYLRPLLMGSGPLLGLAPAPEYTFLIFASPVGNYHKGRPALKLFVEDKLQRAMPGGTGGVKSITNYSPVYLAQTKAKAKGYSDVLFLDSAHGKYVEELAVCNIFIVKGNVVSTPAIQGTILPGVTRKSIIEIALGFGYQVEERLIPVEDLLEADEVFCTGTAVIVNSVGGVTYQDKRVEYKTGKETLSKKLYETLIGIQTGRVEDKMGWTLEVN